MHKGQTSVDWNVKCVLLYIYFTDPPEKPIGSAWQARRANSLLDWECARRSLFSAYMQRPIINATCEVAQCSEQAIVRYEKDIYNYNNNSCNVCCIVQFNMKL